MSAEALAVELAAACGDFDLTYDASENPNAPDCMPWTLTFTHAGEEHHFGWMLASDLEGLFRWAIDFAAGLVNSNGLPVPT